MRFRDLASTLTLAALVALPRPAPAQDSAQQAQQAAQLRAMVEQIARERPPQAEAAAREMLRQLQIQQAALDSLRARSQGEYWAEVARLNVQLEMLRNTPDALRREMMARMFGEQARARELQRGYHPTADSAQERAIRARLQAVLDRHFAAEDSLRSLEIAEVERRLAQVRAETVRRRRERAELVRQMVEEVLRDARRPD
jgi:hypothetical protein